MVDKKWDVDPVPCRSCSCSSIIGRNKLLDFQTHKSIRLIIHMIQVSFESD